MSETSWAARVEGATLVTADHHRETYTRDELELIVAFTDDATDEEIAYALGRSLYAIWSIQARIRSGEIDVATPRRVNPAMIERSYDYVTTFPPGHFD
jgi:hypothetical protein